MEASRVGDSNAPNLTPGVVRVFKFRWVMDIIYGYLMLQEAKIGPTHKKVAVT